jgi:hypothetical protein
MSSNNDYGLYTIALLLVMLIHMIIGFALEHKHVMLKFEDSFITYTKAG